MAPPRPRAILFDIGGVCVISPFQAILDYETENNIPIGYINFAIQQGPYDTGAWQLIERGEVPLDDTWFQNFKTQIESPKSWNLFLTKNNAKYSHLKDTAPPAIDAKKLFWRMMRISRTPDPYMYPALRKLKESGQFVLGALSNTVAFPTGILDDEGQLFTKGLTHSQSPSNPYANDSTDISTCFDIFISSAHVGVRKPDPKAYELSVREMQRVGREKRILGKEELKPEECLFLDDIGINCKFAKKSGLQTIKVDLGKTRRAVEELERWTGLELLPKDAEKARL